MPYRVSARRARVGAGSSAAKPSRADGRVSGLQEGSPSGLGQAGVEGQELGAALGLDHQGQEVVPPAPRPQWRAPGPPGSSRPGPLQPPPPPGGSPRPGGPERHPTPGRSFSTQYSSTRTRRGTKDTLPLSALLDGGPGGGGLGRIIPQESAGPDVGIQGRSSGGPPAGWPGPCPPSSWWEPRAQRRPRGRTPGA